MKLNLPTIVFLVLFLGIGALIVYANATNADSLSQVPSVSLIQDDITLTPSPDTKGLQDDDQDLTDEELREKVLPANDLLLPDLVLADPTRVVIQRGEGVKRLLFDTAFANIGEGDLHMYSTEDEDRYSATQILTSSSGSEYHVSVGEFQF